ncbi:MAG: hypothetical protein IPG20_11560 [Gammaproteobacteria bacterium]|nr:hypothetical protein [Gammaproteobacteria bacterium]
MIELAGRRVAGDRRGAPVIWLAALLILLAGTYAIYSLGFYFGYSFDDESHLAGLDRVHDLQSALYFVFDGQAGPLGRPLALTSFLLQMPSWPTEPADFARANTLVHLLNSLLVIWLSYRLARYLPALPLRREWFALAVGATWASSPLLLSTSMMLIQRMTSLAALFGLGGLLAFVMGRELLAHRRRAGLLVMSAGLGLGTLLGALCKENGVLLPLLALAIEALLLRPADPASRVAAPPAWWTMVFLLIPGALLLLFILNVAIGNSPVYPGRSFDMHERLLTEGRILFRYIRLLLLPTRSGIGPFQDEPELSTGLLHPWTTALAILGWLGAMLAAWQLAGTRWRVVSFAICWFLIGQLLESTVFGLELYFEHRNYLPAFGVYFALVALIFAAPITFAFRAALFALLLVNQVFVLRESALVWSDPRIAGPLWHHDSPGSLRALQLHAFVLGGAGEMAKVVDILEGAPQAMRQSVDFSLYRLEVLCELQPGSAVRDAAIEAIRALETQTAGISSAIQIAKIRDKQLAGKCPGISEEDTRHMLELVTEAGARAGATAIAGAHYHLAKYWMERQSLEQTMYHLEKGFELMPQLGSAQVMINVLLSAGLPDQAALVLADLRKSAPWRPFVRRQWLDSLAGLQAEIDQARTRAGQAQPVPGSQPRASGPPAQGTGVR